MLIIMEIVMTILKPLVIVNDDLLLFGKITWIMWICGEQCSSSSYVQLFMTTMITTIMMMMEPNQSNG